MESDGLWRHTGRTDKPETEKKRPPDQVTSDKGFLGPDGKYYTNATAYYRAMDNK